MRLKIVPNNDSDCQDQLMSILVSYLDFGFNSKLKRENEKITIKTLYSKTRLT